MGPAGGSQLATSQAFSSAGSSQRARPSLEHRAERGGGRLREGKNQFDSLSFYARGHTRARQTEERLIQFT